MVSAYEVVRDRIISSLESGAVPWQQTWQSMCPMNLATGRPYRGINQILLAGHTWWGTYNQIKHLGGYVRKGSAADVIRAAADAQRAADFLTGAVRRRPFSGRSSRGPLLPVVAAEPHFERFCYTNA